MNIYQNTFEDEYAWVDEYEDDIEEMCRELAQFEDQIRRLETKFRMTQDPKLCLELSRARRVYFETLCTVDFLRMRMAHRLEWQLHPIGGRR